MTETSQTRRGELRKVAFESETTDLLEGCARWEIPIHAHGFVALVDVMPRRVAEGQTADAAIVQAARVSYGAGTKKLSEDRGLIRYLMRHRHTTPFEMVELKFHVGLPIFLARQWIRHRTANVNEYSGRYSVMPSAFYRPTADNVRAQSKQNRQGGEAPLDEATAAEFLAYLDDCEALHGRYEALLEKGVSRELARIGLPQSVYTQWYWKVDLHNLLHFLSLRADAHAQQEIRDYALAMLDLLRPIAPVTLEAFEDYRLHATTLSRLEIEALRSGEPIDTQNKREAAEWQAKLEALGMAPRPEA